MPGYATMEIDFGVGEDASISISTEDEEITAAGLYALDASGAAWFECTLANERVTVDTTDGVSTVTILFPHELTRTLTPQRGTYNIWTRNAADAETASIRGALLVTPTIGALVAP